eukprot:COSAG05_NODE_825_length_7106_cov_74.690881_16_plen_80_part_00
MPHHKALHQYQEECNQRSRLALPMLLQCGDEIVDLAHYRWGVNQWQNACMHERLMDDEKLIETHAVTGICHTYSRIMNI